MKIDKQYITNNRDKEAQTCKVAIEVPWNRTSLSSVYSHLDEAMPEEIKGIYSIVDYHPISFERETDTFVLEVVIDVQDIDFEDEE